jgi:GH24 family phage-related lysozyme (muramidase)
VIANPANATLNLSSAGATLIQNDEDRRGPALVAFKPTPSDVWTLGWGHTRDVCEGDTCTVEQARAWFVEDMAWAQAAVLGAVTVPLNQNQFDALVSFTENEGATAFVVICENAWIEMNCLTSASITTGNASLTWKLSGPKRQQREILGSIAA